nr:malto-oligosyltrehalose synthase [Acidimicrobiia bacterium]
MAASRIATYRIQLTPDVGFADVVGRFDHLRGLGVSHVYLSPVTEAVPGSTHGYDVVDHGAVRAELGGADGLFALLDAAAERDMAVLVDHVPNHVAVGRPELNRPWWALLRDGEGSAASRWFDVDWDGGAGRVVLPVLGEPLDELLARRDVEVVAGDDGGRLRIGELHLPLADGTASLAPMEAVGAQHYRLVHWRSPERNVRRFFTIDDLVAVCVEHEEVAVVVDTVPRLLADHPGFGGVRVDHVDGLADPGAYLAGLRAIVGPDRWVLVEKILAPDERLPAPWPVDGTTGYEHAAVLEHAMLDRAGWATMADRWQRWTGDARPFRAWELEARREVLA